MKENDEEERIRVQAYAPQKPDRRVLILSICLGLALLLAVGAAAGLIGYKQGKNNVTVLHTQNGETVNKLSATGERTVQDVVEQVADAVVEITCTVRVQVGGNWFQRPTTYSATSAGSGVILSEDGTIVTNHHVIEGATDITVRLRNGATYAATLVGSDRENDIAVLKISAENLTYATFGESAALKVGQTVVVIGNPLGALGGSVTHGIISALDRDIKIDDVTMRLLQTDAAINSGNSGGGMFDLDGRLVGIVNAKSTGEDVEGLGFAIPADTVLAVVQKLLK